jgi:hypothetical protein
MIMVFDKKKAIQTKLQAEDGPMGASRRQIQFPSMYAYSRGVCDRQGSSGLGSPLFYIISWAMIWPVDYKKDAH